MFEGISLIGGSNFLTIVAEVGTSGLASPIVIPLDAVVHGGFVWDKSIQNTRDTIQKIQPSGGGKGTGEFSNGASLANKVNIPKSSIKHSNVGDFTTHPKTGDISKMKDGGHGQSNIEFLEKNNVDYNINKVYENGVRVGNVPRHKVKAKRAGSNQSWFPESWIEPDITVAGAKIAELPEFANAENGEAIFGEYNGVRVGVIKTNGEIGIIFPDATKQP